MTTLPATTVDVDLHLFAITPADMEKNQGQLINWCDHRMGKVRDELVEIDEKIRAARAGKMSIGGYNSMRAATHRKLKFYMKVRALLQAGYYIVPPFPVQLFAIRTKKNWPAEKRSTYRWDRRDQPADRLEAGEGRFVSPIPKLAAESYQVTNKEGKQVTETDWYADAFTDVDFPFRMAKPEVIEATVRAINEKVFDALGVLPEYRTTDPMVIGLVYPPTKGPPLHFFVAWWLDTKTLP